MAIKGTLRAPAELDQVAELDGVVQTFAMAMIALTAVDTVMILVSHSSLPMATRIFAVRYGAWLFVPAWAPVGWVARPLGPRRYLTLAAAFATAYTMLTQFRGSWIWNGTFDMYAYSRAPWLFTSLSGVGLALGFVSFLRSDRVPSAKATAILLVGLAASLVASAFLPRWWPNDSEFAATRPLGIA